MGTSTDAILFFVARKRGHQNPWDEFQECEGDYQSKEAHRKAWISENRARIDAWYEIQREIESEFGVKFFTHCSCDYPIPAVATKRVAASRGYPKEIDPTSLAVDPGWTAKLDKWFVELGISKPHETPKWFLASDWC